MAYFMLFTATVIMVGPVCRTREILRNCGYVLRAVFPTEALGAGIYSSVIFGGSMVLANAVGDVPGSLRYILRPREGIQRLAMILNQGHQGVHESLL